MSLIYGFPCGGSWLFMNVALFEEQSLSERIFESDVSLQAIPVGATTFRSALSSFLDSLIEQNSPIILWAKLPRGGSWQLEIERYCKQAPLGQLVCLFSSALDIDPNWEDPAESLTSLYIDTPAPGRVRFLSEDGVDWGLGHSTTPTIAIPLDRLSPLRGEYFVLALAPGFQSLLVARRLRLPLLETEEPSATSARGDTSGFALNGLGLPLGSITQGSSLSEGSPSLSLGVSPSSSPGQFLDSRPGSSRSSTRGPGSISSRPNLPGPNRSSSDFPNPELSGLDFPGAGLSGSSLSGSDCPSPGTDPALHHLSTPSAEESRDAADLLTLIPGVETAELKAQLRLSYSCCPMAIRQMLEGIQQALLQVPSNSLRISLGSPMLHEWSGPLTPDRLAHHASIPVTELLNHWGTLFQPSGVDHPALAFASQWSLRQFQRQEELWRRVTTYRKQAEAAEALQLQHEELGNAVRLKDEFLNMVVQELRTPLTNMKTALSLLNSPSLKPNQRQRYTQLLNTECDRQGSLISGLLNLSQIEQVGETTMQALTLVDIVPAVVSTYQPLAQEKEILLAYTISDELPLVACWGPWLRQILVNLLHNSIKFTGRGGRVWVRAKPQGDYVQIDVQDNGIGISSSEIPKIFNRFYRIRSVTGEDSGGAGLGLTIVQQLLLRCGGSITVNSRLGQGATFSVLLPVYRGEGS